MNLFHNAFGAGGNGGGGGAGSGGSAISDPNVAYIRTDGNDTTGDGSPGKPFLTFQKAVDEGFQNLDFGAGSFGGATFAGLNSNIVLSIQGHRTELGNIANYGYNTTLYVSGDVRIDSVVNSGFSEQPNGGELTIYGSTGLVIHTILFEGSDDGEGFYGTAGYCLLVGPFEVQSTLQGGTDATESGTVALRQGVSVPVINLVPENNIYVNLAIVDGTVYLNNYP
ncbi:hypothetical protein WJU23_16980 [Prosthecobacter sp. SYSU 5D2]|uniref:hypothetical protein n=1 Tax=Prosthecobacter sp. SYSU 5D2 TaxID=3134134 RepID=UPI0031FF0D14